jgi:pSer/pThr/pTyr-binding forkhead associated (FHA) protein
MGKQPEFNQRTIQGMPGEYLSPPQQASAQAYPQSQAYLQAQQAQASPQYQQAQYQQAQPQYQQAQYQHAHYQQAQYQQAQQVQYQQAQQAQYQQAQQAQYQQAQQPQYQQAQPQYQQAQPQYQQAQPQYQQAQPQYQQAQYQQAQQAQYQQAQYQQAQQAQAINISAKVEQAKNPAISQSINKANQRSIDAIPAPFQTSGFGGGYQANQTIQGLPSFDLQAQVLGRSASVPINQLNQYPNQSSVQQPSASVNAFVDHQNHTIIQTKAKEEELVLARAKLSVLNGEQSGQTWFLNRPKSTLGRGLENEFVLQDIATSRRHMEIIRHESGFKIVDLKSGNGTYLNQKRILEEELYDGDTIKVGQMELKFEYIGGITRSRNGEETTNPNIELNEGGFLSFYHAKQRSLAIKDSLISFYWRISDSFDELTNRFGPKFSIVFKSIVLLIALSIALI